MVVRIMKNSDQKITNKEVIYQLINFSLKHRRVMQSYLDSTGVFHAQHRLLMLIAKNPDASQVDLAKMMDVSTATIAVSLKKLENGGYIKRETVQDDNRLNKIIITEKGNKVVSQSREIFEYTDKLVMDGITDEEKLTIYNILKKIDDNIGKMEETRKKRKC